MLFYCTCGRGTEGFVHKELQHVFGNHLEMVMPTDGKVFFGVRPCTCNLKQKLKSLKSVERLMIQMVHKAYGTLDKRGLLTLLHTEMGRPDIWRDYYSIAGKLKTDESFLQSDNVGHTSATVGMSMSNDCKPCGLLKEDNTQSYGSENAARGNEVMANCSELMDKVQTDKMSIVELSKTENKNSLSANVGNYLQETEDKGALDEGHQDLVKCLESGITCKGIDHKPDGNCVGLKSIVKRELSSDVNERLLDRKRQKLTDIQTFRVSCKFSGTVRRKLDTKRTSLQMGSLIRKLTGWTVDLRNPTTEVCLHLNDETLTAGIPLTRKPLSRRSYIKHCGLRTPVAWIMVNLLQIQPGELVLDPMCGKGTILVEACQVLKGGMYLGMDKASSQLKVAMENVVYADQAEWIHLIQGDATGAPFPDSSVDKVVTDAPFGQNHVTDTDLLIFYNNMLIEMSRILKPGGNMVMLTSTSVLTDLSRGECPHHTGGDNQQTEDDKATGCTCYSHRNCNESKSHTHFKYQSINNITTDVENQSKGLKCHQSKDNLTNEPKDFESQECALSEHLNSFEEQIPVIEEENRVKSLQKKRLTAVKTRCVDMGTKCESNLIGTDLLVCNLFELRSYCYMKLGETDAVLCVLKNMK